MLDLVGNPNCWFCHTQANLISGKYRDGDENKISPGPHFVARDFSGAVDYIIQNIDTSVT